MKVLAREMEVFEIADYARGGVVWLARGVALVDRIKHYLRGVLRPHLEVSTPTIYHTSLWERSGHMEMFRENMFITESGRVLKPMNCPVHFELFHEYCRRGLGELPWSIMEFGVVHRMEAYGAVQVPFRNLTFMQDDRHIFIREEHLSEQVEAFLTLARGYYGLFGFREIKVVCSKSAANPRASELLEKAASVHLSETNENEGAFYGPKLEIHLCDSAGKYWQCGTLQLDLNASHKFALGEGVWVLHTALMGSVERFVGMVLSVKEGFFPPVIASQPWYLMDLTGGVDTTGVLAKATPAAVFVGARAVREGVRRAKRLRVPCLFFFGPAEQADGKLKLHVRPGGSEERVFYPSVEEVVALGLDEIADRYFRDTV